MNLDHLRYFIDAVQSESISVAAKKNFVSQSAVSRAIKGLEEEFDSELLEHGRNRFQPNEVGKMVVEKGLAIFDAVADLKSQVELERSEVRGPLSFGCNQAIASYLVAPALSRLKAKYPGIKPEIKLGNTDQLQLALDRREIDFALLLDDGQISKSYHTKAIFQDEFSMMHSPSCKQKFNGEGLIISRSKKGSMWDKFRQQYKKNYKAEPSFEIEVASWEITKKLALVGYGYALLPNFICKEELKNGSLKQKRLKVPSIPLQISRVSLASRSIPKLATYFFNEI